MFQLVSIVKGQTTHQRHPLEQHGKVAGHLVLIVIRPLVIISPARIEARLARAPLTVAPFKAKISCVHLLCELISAIVLEKQPKLELVNALVEFADPQITEDTRTDTCKSSFFATNIHTFHRKKQTFLRRKCGCNFTQISDQEMALAQVRGLDNKAFH